MAYINGVNSSVSSIYGDRNIISGLASGIDTESMIENSVKGYKTQISKLIQNRTKVEWQQERYRSIIGKSSAFIDKYTSYSSSQNLSSTGFFNSAVNVTTQGVNKDFVTATGKPTSDIQILGVKKLATSTTYKVSGTGRDPNAAPSVEGNVLDFTKNVEVSNIAGTMTINYGGDKKVDITFGSNEIFKDNQEFVDAINEKLSKENITIGSNTYKASDRIKAELVTVDGKQQIQFSDKAVGSGNAVYISDASEAQQLTLGLDLKANNESKANTVIDMTDRDLHSSAGTVGEYLSGKKINVTLDGVTRTITLPTYTKPDPDKKVPGTTVKEFAEGIQQQLDKEFGANKITVKATGTNNDKLQFVVNQKGSSMALDGEAIKHLGFGDRNTTYVNTQKNLGQIWSNGQIDWNKLDWAKAEGKVTKKVDSNGNEMYFDAQGYRVEKNKDNPNDETYYRVDDKGNKLFDFNVNGVRVGSFNQETELSTVLNAMNNNREAGVNVSYSQATDQFTFTAKRSGANGNIAFDQGLAQMMFHDPSEGLGTYEKGTDAVISMSVDGQEMIDVTRSDNTFTMDGMTITINNTFGYDASGNIDVAEAKRNAVSFKTSCDADKIVDAVKDMVKDYNEMVTELKKAFSTLPVQRDNGRYYEPLTEEDREGMSESAIKAHEEKAKEGILFRDRELSAYYDQLTQGISMEGELGAAMRHIGITAEYENGLTTLHLDEKKLRDALQTEPDTVRDVFTQSTEAGAKQDGLMQSMKKTMDMYAKVHGSKGILVEKAGSPLAGTTLFQNDMQKKMDQIDEQINKVKEKMGNQIDFYSRQFAQMEQLIAQMNSQSSALAGLMGGY